MTDFGFLSPFRYDPDAPRKMVLRPFGADPVMDKNGEPSHIMLAGPDSAAAHEFRLKQMSDALERRNAKASPQEIDSRAVDYLVALTVGWHLVDAKTGEPIDIPCTPQNVRALYTDRTNPWVRTQVDEFIGERKHFFDQSSKD